MLHKSDHWTSCWSSAAQWWQLHQPITVSLSIRKWVFHRLTLLLVLSWILRLWDWALTWGLHRAPSLFHRWGRILGAIEWTGPWVAEKLLTLIGRPLRAASCWDTRIYSILQACSKQWSNDLMNWGPLSSSWTRLGDFKDSKAFNNFNYQSQNKFSWNQQKICFPNIKNMEVVDVSSCRLDGCSG